MNPTLILTIFASVIIGALAGYLIRKQTALRRKESAETEARKVLEEAKTKQKEILIGAKDKALEITEAAKEEEKQRRAELSRLVSRLEKREENLDRKIQDIEGKEGYLVKQASRIDQGKREIQEIKKKQFATLEKVAGLSKEKARDVLLEMTEKDMKERILEKIKKMEEMGKEETDRKVKEIMAQAIERYALSHASEGTATTISIPSDELKGRIIGREGRNIKALERLTGVEIVVDDTPEAIVISGFNPIRRQIAKLALDKLIEDGRIHPARIEEQVEIAKREIASSVKEAGEKACFEAGVAGLDPKMVQLLGRLKYRTSYGQNVLIHSLEVAGLASVIAEELGADVAVCKKAGLLHDIGKSVDHEVEGTHIEIGKKILKKFGIKDEVIWAMEAHHEDVPFKSLEAVIIRVADAISGARPGARRDTYEAYVKRLEELENVANSFKGVEKSYAIQAGREVRIFVTPEKIDDLEAAKLSRKIADKIEKELKYPGEIKVNVIRETRAVDYAR